MVDPRDFLNMDDIDPELEARADQLQLMGGAIARKDKRGTALKRHGHLWIDAAGRAAANDVVVCDHGDWAMTLITDMAPPTGREVELEWEGEGGILKRAHGRVTGIRHGTRDKEPFPDLFFARFESAFL
jgi:hypothetical protein